MAKSGAWNKKKKWIRVSHGVIKPKWLFFSPPERQVMGRSSEKEGTSRVQILIVCFVGCALANIWAENTLGCAENFIRASRWTASNESRRRPPDVRPGRSPEFSPSEAAGASLLAHFNAGDAQAGPSLRDLFCCGVFVPRVWTLAGQLGQQGAPRYERRPARCLNVNLFPFKGWKKRKSRSERRGESLRSDSVLLSVFPLFKLFHHCLFN